MKKTTILPALVLTLLFSTLVLAVDTTPPQFTDIITNKTNNTGVYPNSLIMIYAHVTDDVDISLCWNSSKINTSGNWVNGSFSSAGGLSPKVTESYFYRFPNEVGSNLTVKIYCNDTSNNENVTGTLFYFSCSCTAWVNTTCASQTTRTQLRNCTASCDTETKTITDLTCTPPNIISSFLNGGFTTFIESILPAGIMLAFIFGLGFLEYRRRKK